MSDDYSASVETTGRVSGAVRPRLRWRRTRLSVEDGAGPFAALPQRPTPKKHLLSAPETGAEQARHLAPACACVGTAPCRRMARRRRWETQPQTGGGCCRDCRGDSCSTSLDDQSVLP